MDYRSLWIIVLQSITGGLYDRMSDLRHNVIPQTTSHHTRWIAAAALCLLFVGTNVGAQPKGDVSALMIHSIRIVGNDLTKDYIILREMSEQVGDTLDLDKIEYDKKRIYSLALFNRVDIDYSVKGNEADLIVRVHERWYLYPFPILGFKYGDLKKLYYGLGLVHTNFRGRNEKVYFSFALGYDRWLSLTYQNPKILDHDDIFFRLSLITARVQSLNPDKGIYQQQNHGVAVTLGKRFGLYTLLTATGGYEIWQVSDIAAGRTVAANGRDAFGSLGVNYSYDSRDVREYATEGSYLSLSIMKYGLGAGVDFFRYGYDARTYIPILGGDVLAGRIHGQFTSGGPVPAYRDTYFGHHERIRGYFSKIVEGEDLVGGNVEVRIPILSPRYYEFKAIPIPEFRIWRYGLYAALFADAGKTWFRSEGFYGRPWYSGVGAGLHFLLPYSIIVRTEVAVNRSGRTEFIATFDAAF